MHAAKMPSPITAVQAGTVKPWFLQAAHIPLPINNRVSLFNHGAFHPCSSVMSLVDPYVDGTAVRTASPMASFDFLALPGELRNMIYRFALTSDPPALGREHQYDCRKCTWDPEQPTKPIYADGRRIPGCRCGARTGLGLLLANRQIYWEGASIFWAESHFMFWGVDSFTHLVGTQLRPAWRKSLRSISVFDDRYYTNRPLDPTSDKFLRALFQCRNLRNLEIPPALDLWLSHWPNVETAEGTWEIIKQRLPELNIVSRTWWKKPEGRWGKMMATRSVESKASQPNKIKDGKRMILKFEKLVDRLCEWALTNMEPILPPSLEMIEGSGDHHEYGCRLLLRKWTVTIKARKLLQPFSPETIARNKVLRQAAMMRREARRKSLRETNGWKERLR